jgi:hypothetical protein
MSLRTRLGYPEGVRHAGCPNCRRGYALSPMYEVMAVPLYRCQTCGLTFCAECCHVYWGTARICPNDETIPRLEDPNDLFSPSDVRRQGHRFIQIGEYHAG